jgi:hypothetical protein
MRSILIPTDNLYSKPALDPPNKGRAGFAIEVIGESTDLFPKPALQKYC